VAAIGASSGIITAMPQSLSLKLDAYQQRSLIQVNIPPAQAESFPLVQVAACVCLALLDP
jgi:hypothetical protein